MKRLFLLVSILVFLFILSACENVENVIYPELNDYHCYVTTDSLSAKRYVIYNHRVNLYGIEDLKHISTGIISTRVNAGEVVADKLPKEISLEDFRYRNINFRTFENELISLEGLLLSQGLQLRWVANSEGNLIDTTSPVNIDFEKCYEEPVNFYLRTEEVSRFNRLITGTGVTAELAEMAYIYDSEGIIRLLEPIVSGENGNPLELDILSWEQRSLRENLYTLLKVNLFPLENTRRITVEKDVLKQTLDNYKEVYEYFDSSYFIFLSRFLELDFNWTHIDVYQDRIEFRYRYTISSRRNQRGQFKITLLLDSLGELSSVPPINDESYRLLIDHWSGDSCSPSLSNCQYYTPESTMRTITWNSNDNEISNPQRQIFRDFFEELIEIWAESNKLLVE